MYNASVTTIGPGTGSGFTGGRVFQEILFGEFPPDYAGHGGVGSFDTSEFGDQLPEIDHIGHLQEFHRFAYIVDLVGIHSNLS